MFFQTFCWCHKCNYIIVSTTILFYDMYNYQTIKEFFSISTIYLMSFVIFFVYYRHVLFVHNTTFFLSISNLSMRCLNKKKFLPSTLTYLIYRFYLSHLFIPNPFTFLQLSKNMSALISLSYMLPTNL